MGESGGGRGGGGGAVQRAINPGVWRLLRPCTFTRHGLIIRGRGGVWPREREKDRKNNRKLLKDKEENNAKNYLSLFVFKFFQE